MTFNGKVFKTFGRKDVAEAVCTQIALIWVFNIDYKKSAKGTPLPKLADYFDFFHIYLMNIRTKVAVSSGTGQQGRSKPATKKGLALWKKACPPKKG